MADRNALAALIEAVEGGADETLPWRQVFGWDDTLNADAACRGSLDAAKALHEALLPGWIVHRLYGPYPRDPRWRMQIRDASRKSIPVAAISPDPARAWLLAILRAIAAEGGE